MAGMKPVTGPDGNNPISDDAIGELRRDGVVRSAVAAHNTSRTRAERARKRAIDHAFSFFGSTDVEQASRSNAIARAERDYGAAIERADRRFKERCAAAWNARHAKETDNG